MTDEGSPLHPRDWHVLMALSEENRHGYGIMRAVERDSGGSVTAEVGSLYRVLDRLLQDGLVTKVEAPDNAPSETRGRPRQYYGLTAQGRAVLRREALRLEESVALAKARRLLPER